MGQRLQLQSLFEELLGSRNVYFQPPANVSLKYPCIIYARDAADTKFSDNSPYSFTKRYQVTIIDQDPDSQIPNNIAKLPMTNFSRFFVVDDLNHDIYNLYF